MKNKIKRSLKYVYFKSLCFLLNPKGDHKTPYKNSPIKYWLTRTVPGHKRSAVTLRLAGRLTGIGIKKWLRHGALEYSLTFHVNKYDSDTVEVLAIGSPERVQRFVRTILKSTPKNKSYDVKQYWFNKPFMVAMGTEKKSMPMDLESIAGMIKKTTLSKNPNIYHEKSYKVAELMSSEFERFGYQVEFIGKVGIATICDKKVYFLGAVTSNTSSLGARLLNNKNLARNLFAESGISIAKGKLFNRSQKEKAKQFALGLSSAVIKPVNRDQGIGVTVGVRNSHDFAAAWDNAVRFSKRGVLVEEQFIGGGEARFLVAGGKCIAAFKKIPPHVLGDGVHTISKLIEQKVKERSNNPYLRGKPLTINEHRLSILKQQGYSMSDIPPKNDMVILDWMSSTSTGGESLDITEEVHSSFKQIAEQVITIGPGLDVIGVDILAYDFFKKAQKKNYIVIEANTQPCLGVHLFPVYGTPRNVVRDIVEYMINSIS